MIIIGPLALILILFILFAILNKGAAEKKMRLEFESFNLALSVRMASRCVTRSRNSGSSLPAIWRDSAWRGRWRR